MTYPKPRSPACTVDSYSQKESLRFVAIVFTLQESWM
jgi:hypothetical protein